MTNELYRDLAFVDEPTNTQETFGRLDLTPRTGYVPQRLSLGSPAVRNVQYPRPLEDGVEDSTNLYGARVVGLVIGLMPEAVPGATDFSLSEQLMAWCHPARRFRLLLTNNRSLFVRGDSIDNDFEFTDVNYHMVRVTLVSPNGLIESAEANVREAVFAGVGYSLPGRVYDLTFDREYPDTGLVLGPSTVSCPNDGYVRAFPQITFKGPVSDPQALNLETGERMKVDIDLEAGDSLMVDMQRHQVWFNGVQAHYQAIDFTVSTWWGFRARRDTRVRLIASTSGAGAGATIVWRDRWS